MTMEREVPGMGEMEARKMTYTKRFTRCLACTDGEFLIEHLFERDGTAGPWYCANCGEGHNFKVTDGECAVSLANKRKVETSVLLKIPPKQHSIYFLVRGMRFEPDERSTDEQYGGHRYFYEEHTCPTNWLHHVEEIQFNGDTDPHGLAELVDVCDGKPDGDEEPSIEQMIATAEAPPN
jgi:hypothetical protein